MTYLLKTEPTVYSFADLQREQTTIWDGVTNPVAVKNLRGMKPGDQLFIYHTGDEKAAVGTASVVSVDESDPKKPEVKIKVGKALPKPVTLAEMKARPPERRTLDRRAAEIYCRGISSGRALSQLGRRGV
jgi:predicted RNA-binding protein with PUA-like domain